MEHCHLPPPEPPAPHAGWTRSRGTLLSLEAYGTVPSTPSPPCLPQLCQLAGRAGAGSEGMCWSELSPTITTPDVWK